MTVLRVYGKKECDAGGVPLDWDRCRACQGTGKIEVQDARPWVAACEVCGGHGSLKAAARACAALPRAALDEGTISAADLMAMRVRCEGCGHPMSDGTWEEPDLTKRPDLRGYQWLWDNRAWVLGRAASYLRDGREPFDGNEHAMVHYSPCDEGCRHGGPARILDGGSSWLDETADVGQIVRDGDPVEASWRAVDVRPLGWAHDLRPKSLAVLCLRCLATRSSTAAD